MRTGTFHARVSLAPFLEIFSEARTGRFRNSRARSCPLENDSGSVNYAAQVLAQVAPKLSHITLCRSACGFVPASSIRGPGSHQACACGFQHSPGGLPGLPLVRVSVLLGHFIRESEGGALRAVGPESDSNSSRPICAACGRTVRLYRLGFWLRRQIFSPNWKLSHPVQRFRP